MCSMPTTTATWIQTRIDLFYIYTIPQQRVNETRKTFQARINLPKAKFLDCARERQTNPYLAQNEARAARQKQWTHLGEVLWKATFQSCTCFTVNLYELSILLSGQAALSLHRFLTKTYHAQIITKNLEQCRYSDMIFWT